MRIKTDGSKEYRTRIFERTADQLEENTKTAAVEKACLHTVEDIEAKAEAMHYLSNELPPRKLQQVADMLSTSTFNVDVSHSVDVNPDD